MKMQTRIIAALAVLVFTLQATSGCATSPTALTSASAAQGAASASTPQASASAAPAYDWELSVVKTEIKEKLHTDAGVTRYDGTTAATAYDDAPQAGDVFLLVELTADKTKPGGEAFIWNKLSVQDANGNSYARMENDSFISSHNYKRLPGTDLKLGNNTGWVAFEIPAKSADEKLVLVYSPSEVEYSFQIH